MLGKYSESHEYDKEYKEFLVVNTNFLPYITGHLCLDLQINV